MITKSLPALFVSSPCLPKRTCHSLPDTLIPKKSAHPIEITELKIRSMSLVSVYSSDLYMKNIQNRSDDSNGSLSSETEDDSEAALLARRQQLLQINEALQLEANTIKKLLFLSGFHCNDKVDAAAIRRNLLTHGAVIHTYSQKNLHYSTFPFPTRGKSTSHRLFYDLTFVQKGETCKLAAFATVYDYFSQHGLCPYMPAYKTQLCFDKNGTTSFVMRDSPSLREHAKKSGSVQGEIASPEILETLAERVNFSSHKVIAKNLSEYLNYIVDNINNGIPVVIFTQVNEVLSPDSSFTKQWAEHAVVAIGYDLIADCILVVNHGRFERFDINQLWNAASAIHKTRRVELFAKSDSENNVFFPSIGYESRPVYEWKWKDIHRLYDETPFRLCVMPKAYLYIRDVEKLQSSSYLRKSITSTSPHANFHRTLMTFKPCQLHQ